MHSLQKSPFTVLSLIVLCFDLSAASVADFSFYPAASRACLSQASTASNCDSSTVPLYNACVCSNGGGFVDNSAKCLGANDPNDLNTVYNTLSSNCAGSNTPLVYTLSQFLSAAGTTGTTAVTTQITAGATKVSTVVQTIVAPTASVLVATITLAPAAGATSAMVSVITLTPGQTTALVSVVTLGAPGGAGSTASSGFSQSTSAASANGGSHKLSIGAIIGLAVGIPVLFALLGVILFLLLRSRKQSSNTNALFPTPGYENVVSGGPESRPISSVIMQPVVPDPVKYKEQQPQLQQTYIQPENPPQQPNYIPFRQYAPHQQYPQQPQMQQPQFGQQSQFVQQQPNSHSIDYRERHDTVELQGQPVGQAHELSGHR